MAIEGLTSYDDYCDQIEGDYLGRDAAEEREELEKRITDNIDVVGDCWLYRRVAKGNRGYAQLSIKKRKRYAHRVSYEVFVGRIPDGLTLDHLCRNRSCVNPAHLEPVTTGANVLRGGGPSARNARKTHCQNGHEFSAENTRVDASSGARRCRQCDRESKREIRSTQRAEMEANAPRCKDCGDDLRVINIRGFGLDYVPCTCTETSPW